MYNGLGPFEGRGCLVVGGDKFVDGVADLLRRGETDTLEGLLLEDAEPYLDLIHPGGVGRYEVKFHHRVLLEPAIVFRLVGVQVVEYDVDLLVRMLGHKIIHEIEELPTPSTRIVPGLDLSVPLGLSYFPRGKSSAVSGFGVNHGGDMNIGVSGAYLEVWRFSLNFTHFYGPEGTFLNGSGQFSYLQSLKDRDYVSLAVSRAF